MKGLLGRSYKSIELSSIFKAQLSRLRIQTKPPNVRLPRNGLMVNASHKSVKKLRNQQSEKMLKTTKDAPDGRTSVSESERKEHSDQVEAVTTKGGPGLNSIPSRGNVLQACTVTSSLIAAFGLTIRQILTSLEPLDYILVAFLPGISEELLFRGGLLPLFGFNTLSALGVGALFGILHLGNGRKYSFAVWATFVGFIYGYATIASSSIIVPMAAHGLNNLVGGILWRFSSNSPSK